MYLSLPLGLLGCRLSFRGHLLRRIYGALLFTRGHPQRPGGEYRAAEPLRRVYPYGRVHYLLVLPEVPLELLGVVPRHRLAHPQVPIIFLVHLPLPLGHIRDDVTELAVLTAQRVDILLPFLLQHHRLFLHI